MITYNVDDVIRTIDKNIILLDDLIDGWGDAEDDNIRVAIAMSNKAVLKLIKKEIQALPRYFINCPHFNE